MKFDKDLDMSGHQIKQVGEPKDPNDAVNKEFFDKRIASWEGTRHYLVDSKHGNDSNPGYLENEFSSTFFPVKSLERLSDIIPRIGSGASISITIESGTYGNLKLSLMDYDEISIIGLGSPRILGKYNCLKINEYNDTIQIANLDGSNAYIQNFNFNACRARFDENTITSSLRNKISEIYTFTSRLESTLHIKELLKVKPCPEDIIVIEEPSIIINSFELNAWTFNSIKLNNLLGSKKFVCNTPLNKPDITFCYGPDIL